jgi:2-oxoglutarate ferredoxin oxidoreductase subunit beta
MYGRKNRLGEGLDMMKELKEGSVIKNGTDTREVGIKDSGKIICGKFVDRDQTSFLDMYNIKMAEHFGPSYKPYEGVK